MVDDVAAADAAAEVDAAQIDVIDVKLRMLPDLRHARRHAGGGDDGVDDGHLIATGEQSRHQTGSDEAGPAGDQDPPAHRDALARGSRG